MNLIQLLPSYSQLLYNSIMKHSLRPLTIKTQEQSLESSPSARQIISNIHQPNSSGVHDSQDDRPRLEQSGGFGNVIEFQEFVEEQDRESDLEEKVYKSSSVSSWYQLEQKDKIKKKKVLEILDIQESNVSLGQTKEQTTNSRNRQPPAPSNKKSSKSKAFIFPNSPPLPPSPSKEQIQGNNRLAMTQMAKSFDRQRQQFYRQKSRLQKQLLVKDGQIQILQKTITGLIGGQNKHFINGNTVEQYEEMLLEREKQIDQLMCKVNNLSQQLSNRGEELIKLKSQCGKMTHLNQTLNNQLFLYQHTKNPLNLQPQFTICSQITQKTSPPKKEEGIYQLQKRLQNLTFNRKELEDKKKYRSLSYTTKGLSFGSRQNVDTSIQGHSFYRRK